MAGDGRTDGEESPVTAGSVVVGMDPSDAGRAALRWAHTEAGLLDRPLVVVRAYDPIHSPFGPDLAGEARVAAEALVGEELGAAALAGVSIAVRPAAPAAALASTGLGAEMVVVGTRHKGQVSGLLLGSVARASLSRAHRPVVVVPEPARPGRDASEPAVSGPVVVGVDGSELSYQALVWAAAAATRRDRGLVVAHCWTTTTPVPPAGVVTAPLSDERFAVDVDRLAGDMLARLAGDGVALPASIEVAAVRSPVGPGLVSLGDTASLLVVGSRGQGQVAGVVVGSIAQQVVGHPPCPVACIPLPDGYATDRVAIEEES